jgi:hypothetical protein
MKKRLAVMANHRRILLERIETQRRDVADIFLDLQKPFALADTGLQAVRFIRNHPGWVAGSFAALLSLGGKGGKGGKSITSMAQKGWRWMFLYPAILTFGLKYLFPAFRSPNAEELLTWYPEESNSEVDHSQ